MTNAPNRQAIYGPLALERQVKDDGRKLILYTLRHGARAQTSSAQAQADSMQTQMGSAQAQAGNAQTQADSVQTQIDSASTSS